jgi:hypothetical protein
VIGVIMAAAELVTPVTNSFVVSFRAFRHPPRLDAAVEPAVVSG